MWKTQLVPRRESRGKGRSSSSKDHCCNDRAEHVIQACLKTFSFIEWLAVSKLGSGVAMGDWLGVTVDGRLGWVGCWVEGKRVGVGWCGHGEEGRGKDWQQQWYDGSAVESMMVFFFSFLFYFILLFCYYFHINSFIFHYVTLLNENVWHVNIQTKILAEF